MGLQGYKLCGEELTIEDESMKVSDLLCNNQWNLNPIMGKISNEEKSRILSMVVPNNSREDRVIWMANRDGCYSVKSGYVVAKRDQGKVVIREPGTSYGIPDSLWKCIWNLSVPPKIKHFLWRVGVGAIATKEALFKRKCTDNPGCPICWSEIESIEHMLFLCPWSKYCWFGSPLGLKFSKWSVKRCEVVLCDMLYGSVLDEYGKSVFATMCWWIWKRRCNWVFRGEKPDACEVVRLVIAQVDEFWQHKLRSCGIDRRVFGEELIRMKCWCVPAPGSIKINVDGSYKEKTGEASIGIVCRNEWGEYVGGMGSGIKAQSPLMSECVAFKEALLNRYRFHGKPIIVETDCEKLYRLIMTDSVTGCEWECWDLVTDILRLLKSLKGVSVSLVARRGNRAADVLAAVAKKEMCQLSWLEGVPSLLSDILLQDINQARDVRVSATDRKVRKGIG